MTAASIPGEFVALAWRLKQNSTVMFNPQILAASWVEKMVSLYSPVVEEWVAIPEKHPKLKILKELDRFIEGTMEKMRGSLQRIVAGVHSRNCSIRQPFMLGIF